MIKQILVGWGVMCQTVSRTEYDRALHETGIRA